MAEPFLDQAPCSVGNGYKVAFRFARGQLDVIWEPRQPLLKGQMLRRYRRARHSFLNRLAHEVGGSILTVEL